MAGPLKPLDGYKITIASRGLRESSMMPRVSRREIFSPPGKSAHQTKSEIRAGILSQNAEKRFRNLIKSTPNQIVFTIFRLIWIQTDCARLDPNRSENGQYNLILV